jgi:hypothetical protein
MVRIASCTTHLIKFKIHARLQKLMVEMRQSRIKRYN